MESENTNNNGGDGQQQLRRSARIRKLNKLASDGKPAAGGEVQPEPEDSSSSKKNRDERNGLDLEPPAKKPRIDNPEELREIANSNGLNLAKSTEQNDEASETSTTIVDLPSYFRPLPLELNCEIFKCLKLPNQLNFIWGLGRGIYGMFGKKLLTKTKRLRNPAENAWGRSNGQVTISEDGLIVRKNTNGWQHIYAMEGFPISGEHCRKDYFPGTICYYYEVEISKAEPLCVVGLVDGQIPPGGVIGYPPNSYAILILIPNGNFYQFRLSGREHDFEFPEGVIPPELKETGNVVGCGILMNPDDKLTIFFTVNGILIDRQFPIDPTVDHLIPTVILWDYMSVEANFGDNPAKPFEYDIKKCPGMGLEWI